MTQIWERLYVRCIADAKAEPIEILPGPDLFGVEFELGQHLGVSVILPATCALSAQLKAWELFPEHKHHASSTTVYSADYCEVDWETGRCFMSRRQKVETIPLFLMESEKGRVGEGAKWPEFGNAFTSGASMMPSGLQEPIRMASRPLSRFARFRSAPDGGMLTTGTYPLKMRRQFL